MSRLVGYVCNMRMETLRKLPAISYSLKSLHTTPVRWSQSESKSKTDLSVSRFSIPDRSVVDKDIKAVMDAEEKKSGFLGNVHVVFSRRPAEFRNFMRYFGNLMEDRQGGSLTKAEKELFITATSARNGCLYCTVSHGAFHRQYSKRPLVADQVSISVENADLSPRERAIVELSLKIAAMEHVTDDDIDRMVDHGLDREDVWDIGAITAFMAMANRYAYFSGMQPNEQYYTLGRKQN